MEFVVLEQLFDMPPEVATFGLALCALRPLGLLFGFTAFGWAFGAAGLVLRSAIAIGLGLPVLFANVELLPSLGEDMTIFSRVALTTKEFLIGLIFGFLASLPFLAYQMAGSLVDGYRGEQNPSIPGGSGEQLQVSSLLFVVVAFLTFFASGGLWLFMMSFYRTYAIWPLASVFPGLSGDALLLVVDMMRSLFTLLLRVGLPLLALMALVELVVVVGARFARRFQLENHIWLVKNVAYVFAIPLYTYTLARVAEEFLETGGLSVLVLRGIFE